MKTFATTALFLLFLLGANASGLKGTYTINPKGSGSTNYSSFRKAVKALRDSGISGPVIFNISDGKYNESISIDSIAGTSSVNTVTFQSKSGDSTKVSLDSTMGGTGFSHGYTLRISGSKYLIIRQMTITNMLKTYSYGDAIQITGGASHIRISNSVIRGNNSGTMVNYGRLINETGNFNENYIEISNNHLVGNNFGIYMLGLASLNERGNVIINNKIDSQSATGISCYYQDSLSVLNNIVYEPTGPYGMIVSHNSCKDSSFICNNFVTVLKGISMMSDNNDKVNFYFNSFYGGSTLYGALLYNDSAGKTVRVINNIFWNTAKGYTIASNPNGVTYSNYNDIYSNDTSLVNWNGVSCSSLAKYKTLTGLDNNSLSVNPVFKAKASGDLHLSGTSNPLRHKGKSLPGINIDIDNELRTSMPNIGADDEALSKLDAGISSIDSPVQNFCTGTGKVWVSLRNFGTDTLKSVVIRWAVDKSTKSAYHWKGVLPTGKTTSIYLGTMKLLAGQPSTIISWTDSPNVSIDDNTADDTMSAIIGGQLSGTYTIGGGGPDFITFRKAVNTLCSSGVCGSVLFRVRDGKYNESINIGEVKGTSAINTVVFQSQSLDSTKVILDTTWGGSGNYGRGYVLKINGASHITFRKMTIQDIISYKVTTSGPWDDVIQIKNGASYITLENNILQTNTTSSGLYTYGYVVNDDSSTNDNFLTLKNNIIRGGFYGVTLCGSGKTTSGEYGSMVSGNLIDSALYTGLFSNYQDSMTISNNKLLMNTGYYGISISHTLFNSGGLDTSYLCNNFVDMVDNGETALVTYNDNHLNIYYNSFITQGRTFTLFLGGAAKSSIINLKNNIIYTAGNAEVLCASTNAITHSDFNDIYTGYKLFANWNGSSITDLSDFQKTSGLDKNSISTDPQFADDTKGDLHLTSASNLLFKSGIPIPLFGKDIDGDARNPRYPCIGADEIKDTIDVGISLLTMPGNNSCGTDSMLVKCTLKNYSTMSLKDTVRINAICRSSSATLKLDFKSSALASGADTSFILGFAPAVNTSKGGVYIINVSGALKGDEDSYNDTASTLLNIHPLPATHFTINFLSSKKYRLHALDSTLKNYTWKISDTTTDSGFVIDHAFKTTGVYTISLATTNKYGCVDSWSHTLSPLVTGVAIENENPTMKIRTNPNPFISYTNIYYTLPVAEQVSIEVYDLTGHHVATIANEINSAGEHSIPFYPEQYHLAHGMYLLKCRVDDTIQVKQIMYGE